MKILWLSHFVPYPPRGGALQRSHHLLRHTASRHQVTLLTLNQRARLPTEAQLQEAIQALERLGVALQVFPIPADRGGFRWISMAALGFFQTTPYDVNWLRSPRLAQAVASVLRREPFDVIHVDTIGLMPMLPESPPASVVLNHHNVESHMLFRRAEREESTWKKVYMRREAAKLAELERRAGQSVALNLVVSDLDGERLRSVAPAAPTCVIANGVDTAYFAPGQDPVGDGHHLVFAGSLGWYPNHDAMMFFLGEVWPELVARDPHFRFSLIGRSPRAEVCELAAADSRIAVTGEVPDVRPYAHQAGIYVCPIRDGGGTRLKILDALAMGKAMVATSMAVEGLEMIPGQHFLPANSPEEFVRYICELRDQPELRRRLGSEGRRLVESRFAWPIIGAELEAAYRSVARTPVREGST